MNGKGYRFFLVFFLTLLPFSLLSGRERYYYSAGTLLPGITPEMNTAGFWLERHPAPDRAFFEETSRTQFNQKCLEIAGRPDILSFPPVFSGEVLAETLVQELASFEKQSLYNRQGRVNREFYREIYDNLYLEQLSGQIKVQSGLILHRTDQRFLPTSLPLYAGPGQVNFDLLQNNLLEIGTPVIILHTSRDGRWQYVEGPWTDGWVKAENVVAVSREQLLLYVNSRPFVVVTEPLADVYSDRGLTRRHDTVGMGAKLPLRNRDCGLVEIILPGNGEFGCGYLKERDVHRGYLPCTARAIIEQAFRYLHLPYGWGGQYGFQDCSGFIQAVFATAGVQLPRNSREQRKVGRHLGVFDRNLPEDDRRRLLLKEAVPGITLLTMPGHSLLYLGALDGRPYVIHSLWAFSQRTWHGDVLRVVNRVVVSDLELGAGTRSRKYLLRLSSAALIAE